MKILMIGLGSIGQRHVRNIRKCYGDSVEIIAYRVRGLHHTFSDTMQIREGVSFEEEYGVTAYYDLSEALAERPDVAFITNITSEHIPCAIKAAEAECDIFLEKPISTSMEGISKLQSIIAEKKLVVGVGFQNRYHPCLKRLKELLSQNVIGNILSVDVEMGERLITMHSYEDYRGTYMAQKRMGGGVIFNQQIHELDYISWLFGTPVSVYSVNGKFSDLEIDVDDVCSSLYVVEREGRRIPVYAHADFLQSPPVRRCKVIGNDGIILVDLMQKKLEVISHNGSLSIKSDEYPKFDRNNMYIEELVNFFKAIADRDDPAISFESGLYSLKMALAAQLSSENDKVILLD